MTNNTLYIIILTWIILGSGIVMMFGNLSLVKRIKSSEKEQVQLKETIDHLSIQNQALQEMIWLFEEEADDQKIRFRMLLDETEYTINVLQGEIMVLSILNKD